MNPLMREGELEQIRRKHPERIPVIVTRSVHCDKRTPDLKRHKFLVPNHFVFGDVIHTVRKWLTVPPEQSLFLFVTPEKKSEFIPAPSSLLIEIHDTYRHHNGVLYMAYTLENTFG